MTITSIKDEMDFLENYVRLQEFNFPNGIDYTFSCENVVSKSDTYVRSMIIQPIIENSLIHGFVGKEENCKLEVVFYQLGNELIVTITDNGIGRDASLKLNKQKQKGYRSWATTILKEKSIVLKELYNENLTIHTEDLFENNTPLGTCVTIRLKIIEKEILQ